MEGEARGRWGTTEFTWKCSLSSGPALVKCCHKVIDLHKILRGKWLSTEVGERCILSRGTKGADLRVSAAREGQSPHRASLRERFRGEARKVQDQEQVETR